MILCFSGTGNSLYAARIISAVTGDEIVSLNDRLKLRSMVAAEKGGCFYVASEESAIRAVEPNPERIWAPRGGEPVIVRLNEGGAR